MNHHGKLLTSLAAFVLGLLMSIGLPAQAADNFTPISDFTDNGDGTVTHKLTDLTWMRCSMGQTWTGVTCSGNATDYSWNQARSLGELCVASTCPALWRLPSPWELVTIVDYDTVPAINATIFPNTPTSSGFWSSMPLAEYLSNAWSVSFGNGNTGHGLGSDNLHVRLVRSRQSLGTLTTPSSDFTDNGDGTVTHKMTRLIWKRCSEGQTWTGATCSGAASSHTYEQAMKLSDTYANKTDWRVPNVQELQSIVEYGVARPAINTAIFPNTPLSYFWSRSTYAVYSSDAWMVDFNVGTALSYEHSGDFHVRLVRGIQLDTSASSTNSSDCLFNWAEERYSQFLSPTGATSGTLGDYYYRYYSETRSYLATKSSDNHLYFMGPATGNAVSDLGVVSGWLTQAGCQ